MGIIWDEKQGARGQAMGWGPALPHLPHDLPHEGREEEGRLSGLEPVPHPELHSQYCSDRYVGSRASSSPDSVPFGYATLGQLLNFCVPQFLSLEMRIQQLASGCHTTAENKHVPGVCHC